MPKKNRSFTSIVLETLGWPLFWGLAATAAFYLMLETGVIQNRTVLRYFAGHPVEYVETALFFVGVMALLMKAADLASQFRTIPATTLPEAAEAGDPPQRAVELLESLQQLRSRIRNTYLARRLANILRYIHQSDSVEDLDEQMRYLADVDAERSHEGYSLVRMIVWATPMLGFLGTVIGITLALGDLSPEALINAPKEAMQGLLAGLSIAFDTTALALSLSIVLMFAQFVVREVEMQLLTLVDRHVEDELIGRFQQLGGTTDPHVGVVKQMSKHVLETMHQLVQQQSQTLETTLRESQRQWSDALQVAGTSVQTELEHALQKTIGLHVETIEQAESRAIERSAERWDEIQQGMQQQASLLADQVTQVNQQGEVMLKVLEATGDIRTLESSLNDNLSALANAKNFADTVVSLSAAIQLLSARLGIAPAKEFRLDGDREGRAA